jgi:hypothetical protein
VVRGARRRSEALKKLIRAIQDYVDDTYRPTEARRDVGCPLELAYVLLGERFGQWPWTILDAPADRVERFLAVIGAESEAHGDHAGMAPGDEIYREDED